MVEEVIIFGIVRASRKMSVKLITVIPIKEESLIKNKVSFLRRLQDVIDSALIHGSSKVIISNYPQFCRPNVKSLPIKSSKYGRKDKLHKVNLLFEHCLLTESFTHVHLLDSDDFVINDVTPYLVKEKSYYSSIGYENTLFAKPYLDKNNFHLKNGSNLILSREYLICRPSKQELEHKEYPFKKFIDLKGPFIYQNKGHGDNLYFKKNYTLKRFAKSIYAYLQ